MKPGSVLVDISIDQGGCFEDSRPTTHADPIYRVHDSVFYCVANMPGAVPHTSTYALTNVTLPYALELANRGWRDALRRDPALALGLNTHDGHVTYGPVAEAHGMAHAAAGRGAGLTARWTTCRTRTGAAAGCAYLDHLTVERGLSAQHARVVPARPGPLLAHLAAAGVDELAAVDRRPTSTGYLAALRDGDADHPPLSAASAARAVSAVRGLHRFAAREGLAADDVSRDVRPPAPPRRLPKALDVDRGRAAARAPSGDDGPLGLRDRALLEFLYGTGARISEAVGLAVDDLDLADGTVRAARQGRPDPAGAARRVRPRGAGRVPGPGAARARRRRPRHPGGVPQRPRRRAVAAERLDDPAPRRRAGPGCRSTGRARCRRTRCATRSRPTCSTAAPTCGWCRSCSGTPR